MTRYEYDQLNRRTRVYIEAMGAELEVTMERANYDWTGRKWRQIDADGKATAYAHDSLGRLAWVITDVDSADSLAPPATPFATIVEWTTWAKGTRSGTFDSTATQFAYDETGNLLTQRDGRGNQTTFAYDRLGRRTSRLLPGESTAETWTHDFDAGGATLPAGKVRNGVRHIDFLNRELRTVYDAMGRLSEKRNSANTAIMEIIYTATGQRARMRDNMAPGASQRETRYAYDDLDRLRVKDTPEGTLTYEYFNGGQINSIGARKRGYNFPASPPYRFEDLGSGTPSNGNGAEMVYALDERNRIKGVNESGGDADATYGYDPVGNLASIKLRNGIQSTYAYNSRNQLTLLTAGPGGGSATASFKYDDGTWGVRRLANSGQRKRVVETIGRAFSNRMVDYDYDGLHRLTVESIQNVAPHGTITYDANPGYANDSAGRGHDEVGNRRSRTVASASSPLLTASVVQYASQRFDARDHLGPDDTVARPDPVQDDNGNTTSYNGYAYSYDLENRLVQRTGGAELNFVYDGDGKRVRKKEGPAAGAGPETWFLWDDRNPTGYAQIVEERTSTGGAPSLTTAPAACYIYGLSRINQNRAGAVHYFGCDGHVRYLTTPAGTISDTYIYDAAGILIDQKVRNTSGSSLVSVTDSSADIPMTNPYRFAGEYLDPNLGLYNLRARDYHPDTGRLWTRDSYEGSPSDPLSLHQFLYCAADPVNNTDPSGMAVEPDLGRGQDVHELFYVYCITRGITKYFDAEIGALYPSIESRLKPDVLQETQRRFFELKPISYRDAPELRESAKSQIRSYIDALKPVSVVPRNSFELVPAETPIGVIFDPVTQKMKEVVIAPSDEIIGLIYYWLRNPPDYDWVPYLVPIGIHGARSSANVAAAAVRAVAPRVATAVRGIMSATQIRGAMIGAQLSVTRF